MGTLFCSAQAWAQNRSIDSLLEVLKQSKDDTVRLFALQNLARETFGYDTSVSFHYLEQSRVLAEKMSYPYGLANYFEVRGILLKTLARKTSTLLSFDSSLEIYGRILSSGPNARLANQVRMSVATIHGEQASLYAREGSSSEAIAAYLKALEVWEASDDEQRFLAMGTLCVNISNVYYDLKQIDKSLEFDKKALGYMLQSKSKEYIARVFIYIGDDFTSAGRLDSAAYYLSRAAPIVQLLRKSTLSYNYWNKMAQLLWKKGHPEQALTWYMKSLDLAKSEGWAYEICSSSRTLGLICLEQLNYPEALKYLKYSLQLADSLHFNNEKLKALQALVTVFDRTNRIREAYVFQKQMIELKDSLDNEASKKAIADMEGKYEAAQKEKEILQLQKDKEAQAWSMHRSTMLNYLLAGSLLSFLILGFLLYRNYRQKQLLDLQRINELELDRKLTAVNSMLRGQEEERSRLARDLHDGLGGILSGVKYSLHNMKDNLVMTPEHSNVFARAMDMIDTSITELRRVAHNMMPEMLVRFGLDEALRDFCANIQRASVIELRYQSFGLENRLDQGMEIIVYRIIQELVNNILKHAQATQALVQLIRESSRLSILVEDNGKGMMTQRLEENKGAGWANIRSRVDYLKGRFDILSEPGKGTSISIDFNW